MANKTLFWSFYVSFCTFYASLRLIRTVFTRLLKKAINHLYSLPLIPNPSPLPPNVIVHKYLRAEKLLYNCRETSTYIESSLQNKLFMQNKANFQKVKLNVNNVLTKDYDQLDTWSIRKNEPKTNPNEPKTNPIKANKMPKQTQYKPKQTQNKPKQTQTNPKQTQFLSTINVAGQGQYNATSISPTQYTV